MYVLLTLLLAAITVQAGKTCSEQIIQPGDFLFQDMDCGSMCEAIEKVTTGWGSHTFSHIGFVVAKGDSLMVIEAIGKDVHYTPIATFLFRSKDALGNPKIVIGRLKSVHQTLILKATAFAEKQVGIAYDDEFIHNNGKYYCSELIYDAFQYANEGKPFFELIPMTFNDPDTGKPFSVWVDYFKQKQMPIPEGKPGCNPGGLSLSAKIDIVCSLY